jgi:hypothetical protein
MEKSNCSLTKFSYFETIKEIKTGEKLVCFWGVWTFARFNNSQMKNMEIKHKNKNKKRKRSLDEHKQINENDHFIEKNDNDNDNEQTDFCEVHSLDSVTPLFSSICTCFFKDFFELSSGM